MSELIAFPDAEAMVVNYLTDAIEGLEVSTRVPDERPNRFVRVTRVGGTKIRLNAESPMVLFECWDTNSVDAFALCRQVRAYVHALAGETVSGVWIYKVTEVGGPVFNPDPNTDLPRYQFTVTLDLKGESL